jgi:hypothetical protein
MASLPRCGHTLTSGLPCRNLCDYNKGQGKYNNRCKYHLTTQVTNQSGTWTDLIGKGEIAGRGIDIKQRDRLPAILNGVTWLNLFNQLFGEKMALVYADAEAASSTKPYNGMLFKICVCLVEEGRPYQFSPIEEPDAPSEDREGCFEDVVFPMSAPKDGILLVHQSHAPCSRCIGAYKGWANERQLPIIVLSDHRKGDIGDDCAAIFVPLVAPVLFSDEDEKGRGKGAPERAGFYVVSRRVATTYTVPAKTARKKTTEDVSEAPKSESAVADTSTGTSTTTAMMSSVQSDMLTSLIGDRSIATMSSEQIRKLVMRITK